MGASLDKLSTVSSNSALYLQELSSYAVKENILTKNSRFLRTVECISEEGRVLVKVFARRGEQAELLAHEVARLESLAGTFGLVKHGNLLPFAKVIVNERAVFVVRQYLAYNLCERLGTRPFLTDLEKRWILFQLLKALDQCHHWGIAHGDVTTENILLTTWHWAYLTDFSPFKPAYLPLEDPSDFTFFFNSSGRTAYIAPERFYSLSDPNAKPESMSCSDLKPSADVFSFGCVAAELFLASERPLFDFSQLLAYRKGEYSVEDVIETIEDPWIQKLVRQCTRLDPADRVTIAGALNEWPDKSFAVLHRYCSSKLMEADPDARIQLVSQDFDELLRVCRVAEGESAPDTAKWPSDAVGSREAKRVRRKLRSTKRDNSELLDAKSQNLSPDQVVNLLAEAHHLVEPVEETVAEAAPVTADVKLAVLSSSGVDSGSGSDEEIHGSGSGGGGGGGGDVEEPTCPPMLMVLSFVFSSIRNVRTPTTKILALKLLCRFARVLSDEIRLQRIVPFIFSVIPHSEDKPLVRATVVRCLEQVLSMVRVGEPEVFQTYIIPRIGNFSKDPDETVRESLAACLASLATSSRRLSETVMRADEGFDGLLYELRKAFHGMVRDLLEDNSMAVKRRILMSLTPLCLFFGRRVSTETFVPFVLTFLSHPQWQLRVAAYHHLLGVMSIVGSKSLEDITLALISKSFADEEEFVIDRAVLCVVSLVKVGLLRKKVVLDLSALAAPLLIHPSKWVRNASLQLQQVVWESLSTADRFVFFCPVVSPFLTKAISPLADAKVLAELLKPAIPRQDLAVAIIVAHELYRKGERVDSTGYSGALMARLKQNSVSDRSLGRILMIASWMQTHAEGNAAKNNAALGPGVAAEAVVEGVVAGGVASVVSTARDVEGTVERPISLPNVHVVSIDRRAQAEDDTYGEDEFRRRFGHISLKQAPVPSSMNMTLSAALDPTAFDLNQSGSNVDGSPAPASAPLTPLNASSSSSSLHSSSPRPHHPAGELRASPGSAGGGPAPASVGDRVHLNVSLDPTQDELGPLMGSSGGAGNVSIGGAAGGGAGVVGGLSLMDYHARQMMAWRPRGTLVAHLHEHSGAVSQVAVSDDHRFFVSGSLDGTVKVWDCERLHTVVTNRSRLTCKLQKGQINSVTMIRDTHSVASACDQGTVHIFNIEHQRRVEKNFSKTVYTGVQTVRLIDRDEGAVFDVRHQDVGPSSVLMYATSRGNIHGWDLRMKQASQESFLMQNSPEKGLLTAVTVGPDNNWLVVGTDLGVYTIWDLRFQIPVRSFVHPVQSAAVRMHSVSSFQKLRNCFWSANADNTVALWDIEANCGRHVIRSMQIKAGAVGVRPAPLRNVVAYQKPLAADSVALAEVRGSLDRVPLPGTSLFAAPVSRDSSSLGLKSIESMSDLSNLTAVTGSLPREQPCFRSLLAPPDSSYLITGGTDCKIRFWNTVRPGDSYTISGLPKHHLPSYSSELQGEVVVQQETVSLHQQDGSGRPANAGLAVASPAHRDAITDLGVVHSASTMLLSADRAGTIKVWL